MGKRAGSGPPQFTPVPEKVKVAVADEEVSGVHDIKDLWRKMDKRTSQLLDYAQSTDKKAEEAKEAAAVAAVRADEQRDRIESIEESLRRGHNCTQALVIGQLQDQVKDTLTGLQVDIQEGIKTRSLAKQAKEEADKAQGSWKAFWGTVAGSFVVLLITGGSAVYYFGQLDERVTQQNQHQVEATKRVEGQVKQLNTKVAGLPDSTRIRALTQAIEASNGHETTDEWCADLSDDDVRWIKRRFPSDRWPRCRRIKGR